MDKTSFEYRMQPIVPPQVIRDDQGDDRWTVYFKEDDRFGVPKAYVVFQLLTQQIYSSPLNAALAELYQTCVSDRLDEYAYDAQLAGLTYDVKILPRGVRVTFGGYNDKMARFASYITKKISKDFKAILPRDDAEFERYKDNLMRALSAFDVRQPFAHAAYYATLNLQPPRFQYSNAQMRDAARTTTLPDLVAYAKELWTSGRGQALVQGNFEKEEALDLINVIDKSLGFHTIPDSEVPPQLEPLSIPALPKTSTTPRLFISEPNLSNGNSASHVMLQCMEPGVKDHVLIELVSAIVQEPFYADLRT
jgi:insulysin